MGLSTAAARSEGIEICIFDLRRGQEEGQELDKILLFFPADCPITVQLSVIGLSEGLITFTRIFSPDAACDVIDAERHSHVFYQAEPDIWMVMVVEKNKELEPTYQTAALQAFLKEVHSLFVMFHGSIRALLEKEPGGGLARSHLYSFVMDYLTDFLVGKKLQLPSFRDCLKERSTVQMLTIGREMAIEVQSLVRVIESSCAGTTGCHSVVLFQDLLVSTTLPLDDTANLFTYAVLRLTPHALSSNTNSWSYLHKGSSAGHVSTGSIFLNAGSVSEEYKCTSRDTSPGRQVQRVHLPRPLQRNKWSKSKDGFLVTDIWAGEIGSLVSASPIVWIKQIEERMVFCVYQHKNITVIILLPVSSLVNQEQGITLMKQQFLENASQKIFRIEEKISSGWRGENAYHISGYRYLLYDNERSISRASPPGKVATLAKDSLRALSKLRAEVDLEKSRAKRDDTNHEKDLEVCMRANNNAWIIARITRGKELYMVLEKARETLLYASEAMERFSDRYCNGAFSLD
ncbi:vacuolar fusion protein CCZ1 homolog [Aristolochia californica]|uniref:vacuolar fusion protein CCZ1 homolog n=1 Tax=Aristolochia californica TaxID=171875 RepID=UPI0035DA211A